MQSDPLYDLKFPIGPFRFPKDPSSDEIIDWINILENFPEELEKAITGLSKVELEWKYRPQGWNIQQLVHHCVDSHLNSFIRFKLALTEDNPTIRPYYEDRWAELPDVLEADISSSIQMIRGLHARWVVLLRSLKPGDMIKTYKHPEHGRTIRLDQTIALYSWHCEHHLAHVYQALKSEGSYN